MLGCPSPPFDAAALGAAEQAQLELQARSADAAGLQAAAEAAAAQANGLTQRCCQLQEDSARLASMLAQRNHELMGEWGERLVHGSNV